MLKKTLAALFGVLSVAGLLALKKPQPIKTVIIDAGHGVMKGGGYNGAHGSYSYEDEICLAIAKKAVAQIAKDHPNIRIVETRPGRDIVGLHERADIANANNGDLFISIHVNAMPPRQAREQVGTETQVYYTGKGKKKKKHTRQVPRYRYYNVYPNTKGTQTYIWGAHKTEDKEIAIRENAQMFSEENYREKYNDIDPNSPEFIALSAVKTKQYWKRSSRMADFVEAEFAKSGRVSQGSYQRQKGIWVLQATAMPSVLIETGFITNKEEEDYLNSEKGQQETAECISRALGNYLDWLEKNRVPAGTTNVPAGSGSAAFLQAIEQHEQVRIKSTR
ncbi:N-acetylmuramoyl-L-alanine amidase [Flaviaesturariibacter flavus]|uniref:N-acetylmuramoyl-L-alanine amidase n=1 Tax=Flaviaesturariibacter flavus TaxID=2502780 RepID=A0A4R1BP62_9BACT|nr:N-acetylmuramoyl-L-alanine amidase [Flaviaesturariibacter flavus]TCJ19097.1 N-acetylmuramoyl-L-alanine amidase [Flaviaesturariibacter flavus]